jgi:DNA-binding Lrp family transcriptional regulator
MRETVISELDLALVNALQLRPRASWAELAAPLGVTASTLARRWDRLSEEGLAWISASPGRAFSRTRCTAFVLVRCRPGTRRRTAERLCAFEEAVTIELTAPGSADLLLDVLAPDLPALGRFLTEQLEPLPDLVSVDCHFATSLYVEGSRWRLRSLDPAQVTALGANGQGSAEAAPTTELDAVDRALLDALARDGRLGLAALAAQTQSSPATVRRRLRRLTDSGVLTFRCDIADALAGARLVPGPGARPGHGGGAPHVRRAAGVPARRRRHRYRERLRDALGARPRRRPAP